MVGSLGGLRELSRYRLIFAAIRKKYVSHQGYSLALDAQMAEVRCILPRIGPMMVQHSSCSCAAGTRCYRQQRQAYDTNHALLGHQSEVMPS
jgi:hypothetical protein